MEKKGMMASKYSDHFSEQAQYYARYRPTYPGSLYEFIFSHLPKRNYAWDCGTGSGQVAAYLADHFTRVYASDISSEQLKYAVRKENLEYTIYPAESTGYPDDFFDLISVAQAIHWFDYDTFYREVRRVGNSGALIAAFGYGMMTINPQIDRVLRRLYDESFGKFFSEVRETINQEYANIPFPFSEISAPRFSTHLQWRINHLEGFLNSWSPIQKIIANEGFNPVEPVIEEISRQVSSDEVFEVTFPVFLRLGRVHPVSV